MIEYPFNSTDAFRSAFASGLEGLLEDQRGLGPFVLALANATFDPGIQDRLRHQLVRRFGELSELCRRSFAAGREPDEPPDDLSVFLRLMAIGFEHIEPGLLHELGPWEVQFNQVRSLRPRRSAGRKPTGIRAAFDPDGFHFNRPFLRKETFWSGRLAGVDCDLLYNKFPFVELHALLVPERRRAEPQHLAHGRHRYVWELAGRLGSSLPGVGFGYNSYGAYASVNHLHFQMFVRERPLPLALDHWAHNGGTRSYPACCERFSDADASWERINELHETATAYNLLYFPGHLYVLPRRRQLTYELPSWCGGQAWYEMAGGVVSYNADDYGILSAADVEAALAVTAEGICAR